jgi:hypothetical protein
VQPQRAHLRPEIAGEEIVAVDRRGARRDLFVAEGPGPKSKSNGLGALGIMGAGTGGDLSPRTWSHSTALSRLGGRFGQGQNPIGLLTLVTA